MTATDLRRLMVANDSRDALAAALDKAARIEQASGAEILIVETFYDPIADEPAETLPREERDRLVASLRDAEQEALTTAIAPLRERVAALDCRLIWARDADASIVDAATEWRAQLLIKPVSEHHPVADFFHTPLDWALMRHAPCAVLISKASSWAASGRVLAAVDAGDEGHAALNREILRRAAALAAILGAELHVATAYPDLGQSPGELQVADDFAGIKADMRESRRRTLSGMLEELQIAAAEMHFLEGRPGTLIPGLARRLQATLTVLGTAARRGVAKLVIGNTAEDLIGRLESDLVTVREPWS
jgi:universal stress protein E